MNPSATRKDCLEATLTVLGDKWTALIVRELTSCNSRFCDLEKSLVGISPRTLSQRLDRLEAEGILERDLYCARPPRYKYGLTPKGQELQAILRKMSDWGARHAIK